MCKINRREWFESTCPIADTQDARSLAMAFTLFCFLDRETQFHSIRVGDLSAIITGRLGFCASCIRAFRIMGILHDIGKLDVPQMVLDKPGLLDVAERKLIERHPQTGCALLQGCGLPVSMSRPILQHHERLNTSGYPSHASAGEICLGARVISVADSYDAMCASRTYHSAKAPARALQELRREAGILYDRVVVDALVRGLARQKSNTQRNQRATQQIRFYTIDVDCLDYFEPLEALEPSVTFKIQKAAH